MNNEHEDEKLDRREKFERDRHRSRVTGDSGFGPRKKKLEPYKRQSQNYFNEYDEEYDEWD